MFLSQIQCFLSQIHPHPRVTLSAPRAGCFHDGIPAYDVIGSGSYLYPRALLHDWFIMVVLLMGLGDNFYLLFMGSNR